MALVRIRRRLCSNLLPGFIKEKLVNRFRLYGMLIVIQVNEAGTEAAAATVIGWLGANSGSADLYVAQGRHRRETGVSLRCRKLGVGQGIPKPPRE